AFATAAVGMFLGLVIFGSNYRRFAQADQNPTAPEGANSSESLGPLFLQCLLPAAVLAVVGGFAASWLRPYLPGGLTPPTLAFLAACVPVILFYVRIGREVQDRADRGRVAALLTS